LYGKAPKHQGRWGGGVYPPSLPSGFSSYDKEGRGRRGGPRPPPSGEGVPDPPPPLLPIQDWDQGSPTPLLGFLPANGAHKHNHKQTTVLDRFFLNKKVCLFICFILFLLFAILFSLELPSNDYNVNLEAYSRG